MGVDPRLTTDTLRTLVTREQAERYWQIFPGIRNLFSTSCFGSVYRCSFLLRACAKVSNENSSGFYELLKICHVKLFNSTKIANTGENVGSTSRGILMGTRNGSLRSIGIIPAMRSHRYRDICGYSRCGNPFIANLIAELLIDLRQAGACYQLNVNNFILPNHNVKF